MTQLKQQSIKIQQQANIINAVEEFLPVSAPYLPPLSDANAFTLVLDMDETLIHYIELPNGQGNFLIRPFALEFLRTMQAQYELVIFTAAQ